MVQQVKVFLSLLTLLKMHDHESKQPVYKLVKSLRSKLPADSWPITAILAKSYARIWLKLRTLCAQHLIKSHLFRHCTRLQELDGELCLDLLNGFVVLQRPAGIC